jgi:uncharacterized repeat protein (TIGR02543 family)
LGRYIASIYIGLGVTQYGFCNNGNGNKTMGGTMNDYTERKREAKQDVKRKNLGRKVMTGFVAMLLFVMTMLSTTLIMADSTNDAGNLGDAAAITEEVVTPTDDSVIASDTLEDTGANVSEASVGSDSGIISTLGAGDPSLSFSSELTVTPNPYATNPSTASTYLRVVGNYQFDNTAGLASPTGALMVFEFKNTDRNYFNLPVLANINYPTGDVNGSGIVIETSGSGSYIVKVPFTNPTNSGSITVQYAFDHANLDGWVLPDTKMADVKVTIEKDGAVWGTKVAEVTSTTQKSASVNISRQPDGDILQNKSTNVTLRGYIENEYNWRLEPGTIVTFTFDYPAGATFSPTWEYGKFASEGTATQQYNVGGRNILTWTSTVIDSSGVLRANSPFVGCTGDMFFPEALFPAETLIEFNLRMTYTHYGCAEATEEFSPTFYIKPAEPAHMDPGSLATSVIGNNSIVGISNVSKYLDGNGTIIFTNVSRGAIDNTCFTWYNDPGYKKANIRQIKIQQVGVPFKSKIVYYIENALSPGTSRSEIQYANQSGNDTGSGGTTDVVPDVVLGQGEYIAKFEIWPLNNPIADGFNGVGGLNAATEVLAFPPQAKTNITIQSKSWDNFIGGYNCFPNGTRIYHRDRSTSTVSLTWTGESMTNLFPAGTYDPNDVTNRVTLPTRAYRDTWYSDPVPYPVVNTVLKADQSNSVNPGSDLNTVLQLTNKNNVNGTAWVDPVVYLIPPTRLYVADLEQEIKVYSGTSNNPSGTPVASGGFIELVTSGLGEKMYKVTLPEMQINNGATVSIPFTYKVDPYATPSTGNRVSRFRATGGYYVGNPSCGTAFGTSRIPNDLFYRQTVGSDWDDTWNYIDDRNIGSGNDPVDRDGNPNTTHLIIEDQGTNNTFNILAGDNLTASAELYDGIEDDWTDMATNPLAVSTVPLSGTGEFKLSLTNPGNTYLGDIRLLDILPGVDDVRVLAPGTSRNSAWDAYLNKVEVNILDRNGDPVGSSELAGYGIQLQYSSQVNPTYDVGGIQRTGTDGSFAPGAALGDTRSFDFTMTKRLPPGYSIEVHVWIDAPGSLSSPELIDSIAYNSFAYTGRYYDDATAGAAGSGRPAPVQETENHMFKINDVATGVISNVGLGKIYKDLDNDNHYLFGTDALYENVTIELWKATSLGAISGVNAYRTTTTNILGEFTFDALPSGYYYVKVIKPTGDAYLFDAKSDIGTDGNYVNGSYVDRDGLSELFQLNPGTNVNAQFNAGIKAEPILHVEIYKNSLLGAKVLDKTTTYASINNVTVTPALGPAIWPIPANHHIKPGTDASQTAYFTFDDPEKTLKFIVEQDYAVKYDVNGATSGNIADRIGVYWTDKGLLPSSNPTRTGYTLTGWNVSVGGSGQDVDNNKAYGELATDNDTPYITLQAQWKQDLPPLGLSYAVSYAPGGDNVTGLPAGVSGLNVGTAYTVSSSIPNRTGYTFLGWIATGGLSGNYDGGVSFSMPASDVVLTANWRADDVKQIETYTVKYLPGAHGTFVKQVTSGLNYSNLTPSAPATNCEVGWEFDGWDKAIAAVVTGNATYTALWSEITAGGGEEEEPPIVNPPVVNPPQSPVDITSDTEPMVEDIAEPKEPEVPAPAPTVTKESIDTLPTNQTGNPVLDLIKGNVALGGFTIKGAWSLLSLLMSLVAVVISVLLVFGVFMRRREDDDEEERVDSDREEENRRRRAKILKTLTVIVGVLTPIVWLILDNLNQPMAWINNWTVFVGITFIVHIALLVVYKLRKGSEEKEEEEEEYNAEVA